MNKLDLIEALRQSNGLSGSEAQKAVEIFFDSMAQALANDSRVEIRGFCTFSVKRYKSYAGRNPKTGERLNVKPKKLPAFKACTDLKKRVTR
jgi:integration host factor subunit beta